MANLGVPELLVIGAILVLLFGGKRIGTFATGLGDSLREFKKATREARDAERVVKTEVSGKKED